MTDNLEGRSIEQITAEIKTTLAEMKANFARLSEITVHLIFTGHPMASKYAAMAVEMAETTGFALNPMISLPINYSGQVSGIRRI